MLFRSDLTEFSYASDTLLDDFAQKKLTLNGNEWDIHDFILQSLQEATTLGYSAKGVIIDNENACTSDFTSLASSNYYCENYEAAIIAYIWSKENPQGQTIERKLYLKYCFNMANSIFKCNRICPVII